MCCIINYKKRNVIDRFWQIFTFYLLLLSWFSCSFWAKSQEWPEKNPLLKLFILTTDIVMFVFIDLQEVHPNLQLSIIAIICTWLRVCLKIFRKGNLWEAKGRLNVLSLQLWRGPFRCVKYEIMLIFFSPIIYFTCTITALLKQVSIGVSKLPYFIYIQYAVNFPNFSRISNSFQIILVQTQRKSKNKLFNTYF